MGLTEQSSYTNHMTAPLQALGPSSWRHDAEHCSGNLTSITQIIIFKILYLWYEYAMNKTLIVAEIQN